MLFYTNVYFKRNDFDTLFSDETTYTDFDSCFDSILEAIHGYGLRYSHTYIYDKKKEAVELKDYTDFINDPKLLDD